MKKAMIFLLLLALVLPVTAFGAGDCDCADRWKVKIDIVPGDCMHRESYTLHCNSCGHEISCLGDYGDHDWHTVYTIIEPTCTDKGEVRQECDICGKERNKLVNSLGGHDYKWTVTEEATCQGGEEKGVCRRCGDTTTRKIKDGPHKYGSWEILTEPTDCTTGLRSRKCTLCGHTDTDEIYPEGTLKRGESNPKEEVKTLQTELIELGYLNDKADGSFGKKTEAAVKAFQEASGLEASGIAWPQTLTLLEEQYLLTQLPPEPEPLPPYCQSRVDGSGASVIVHCDAHESVALAAKELFDSDLERSEVYAQVRALWQNELDRMYEELMAKAGPAQIPALASAQSAFSVWIGYNESLWTETFGEDAELLVIDALVGQCRDLCALMNMGS